MHQMKLALPQWGGRRKGAGRPRTRPRPGLIGPGVPHLRRQDFPSRHPVHVTLRLQPGAGHLRAYRRARLIEDALREVRERFGVRIIHYSIQGNHLHLIVEANGAPALARAMQGLSTRLARRLNALNGRHGSVFADRYHRHVLSSCRAVANAVRYVLQNYRRHARESLPATWTDPLATRADAPLIAPSVWLLRIGWRTRGAARGPPPWLLGESARVAQPLSRWEV